MLVNKLNGAMLKSCIKALTNSWTKMKLSQISYFKIFWPAFHKYNKKYRKLRKLLTHCFIKTLNDCIKTLNDCFLPEKIGRCLEMNWQKSEKSDSALKWKWTKMAGATNLCDFGQGIMFTSFFGNYFFKFEKISQFL